MEEIKIIVADDQPVVRDGLEAILGLQDPFKVVAKTANGQETVRAVGDHHPHVVLMDIHMPVMNGLEATRRIKEQYPQVRIIMLTTFQDDEYILEALKLGASSYLLKDMDTERITRAIQECLDGQMTIPLSIQGRLMETAAGASRKPPVPDHLPIDVLNFPGIRFSAREKQFIELLLLGKSNREIAEALFLSAGTVKNYTSSLYRKLNVRSRAEAITWLHQHTKRG